MYSTKDVEVEVTAEIEDDEILEYLHENEEAKRYIMDGLGITDTSAPQSVAELPSIERDQFMKELREQFRLLKLEWPT